MHLLTYVTITFRMGVLHEMWMPILWNMSVCVSKRMSIMTSMAIMSSLAVMTSMAIMTSMAVMTSMSIVTSVSIRNMSIADVAIRNVSVRNMSMSQNSLLRHLEKESLRSTLELQISHYVSHSQTEKKEKMKSDEE